MMKEAAEASIKVGDINGTVSPLKQVATSGNARN
jgi:hypothetical protein